MTTPHDEALDRIVELVRQHHIGVDEIAARLKSTERTAVADQGTGSLKTLLGYAGGVLVFSGLGLLVHMIWDEMTSAQRVIITLGPGLVAFILGAMSLRDARFARATTPFFVTAAFLQPFGMLVFLGQYFPDSPDVLLRTLAISGVMLAQQAAGFIAWRHSSLAFFSIMFWGVFLATAMNECGIDADEAAVALGISLLCLSRAADRSRYRAIAPFWYVISAAGLLGGFFALVKGSRWELSYVGVNTLMIYLSTSLASRAVLLVSVVGLMGWLAWYTDQYLTNVIGWPIALIALGLVMIALSAYAVRMGQAIKTARA